jgi:hypothetical protein
LGDTLDENILSKNSFCIIIGSYVRKHGISPKNMNIKEYKLLLQSFKSLFKVARGQKRPTNSEKAVD